MSANIDFIDPLNFIVNGIGKEPTIVLDYK